MKSIALLAVYLALTALFLYGLLVPHGSVPPMGTLLDPWRGLYYTARTADRAGADEVAVSELFGPVEVVRDERGVPHIFAAHGLDAVATLGYVSAQDRLFQMDFLPRVAAGRLSEIFGPSLIETDRMLRRSGMDWGARRNMERIERAGGIEQQLIEAYVRGVNAYIDGLEESDYPFEFRLLGYRPDRYEPIDVLRILQYMVFDLTYQSDNAESSPPSDADPALARLFPRHAPLTVPIVPEPGGQVLDRARRPVYNTTAYLGMELPVGPVPRHALAEGRLPGKGSNNWAVSGRRSSTGLPILAGDMHLSLSLPAIWYEVHIVTPEMNSYGVTVPGAPLPVEAFTDRLGWAFTNTGSDQIDHLVLHVDDARRNYLFADGFLPLDLVIDTIAVRGAAPRIDTLYYSHWGPVDMDRNPPVALRWVAHDSSRTLRALWEMNRASSFASFQEALRFWDTPMQNVLYADVDNNIAIRTTGHFPIRRNGDGVGLLDGSTEEAVWEGRIPFDELPFSYNPERGYLTSTNQQPADSTYPYYLGNSWDIGYRSLRIDALLGGTERHSPDDLKRYQSDIYVVQRDLFAPLVDSFVGLSPRADELRALLNRWSGEAEVDRPEPLVLDLWLDALDRLVWDEPAFRRVGHPSETVLYRLLTNEPDAVWFDRAETPKRERAADVLRLSLEEVVDTLEARYGWDRARWRWGAHHRVLFRHFTRSEALRPLWRGPYEFPGFASTLSPAGSRVTTHSASWRMVVDFSTTPPTGYGVYPGGQSGNPFSALYDLQVESYLRFEHYALFRPATVEEARRGAFISELSLHPE
jgi:penicillin amidase